MTSTLVSRNSGLGRTGSTHPLLLGGLSVFLLLAGFLNDRAGRGAALGTAPIAPDGAAAVAPSCCGSASRSAMGANLLRAFTTAEGRRVEHWTYMCPTQGPKPDGCDVTTPPDIPWMVLQWLPYCGPGANCGPVNPAPGATTSPYTLPGSYVLPPGIPDAQSIPNPNFPSANPNHANTTRHWASTPTFRVPIPIIQAAANSSFIYSGGSLLAPTYSWAQFAQDVTTVIQRFTNTPTADIRANISVLYDDTPPPGAANGWANTLYYGASPTAGSGWDQMGLLAPSAAAATPGALIWSAAESGPTGDGINDIIMLQYRPLGMSGGIASMLVDPANGQIIECDVVFEAAYFVNTPPAATSAFIHEIGHAFGLDHTNLHSGLLPTAAAPLNPAPSPAFSALTPPGTRSWFQFPAPVPTNTIATMSGMTSTVMRFSAGTNFIGLATTPLHPDDATGLSRIYPVAAPYTDATGVARDPLINTSATIRGYVATNTAAPDPLRNVIPMLYRVNMADPAATFPPMPVVAPVVGTVSGLARHSNADVVGMVDTATGQRGNAAYEVIGIPVPLAGPAQPALPSVPGTRLHLVVESMPYLGIDPWPAPIAPIGAAGPSEWFFEPLLNWTAANTAPRVPVQHMLRNNETAFANGTPRFVGSLAFVAGTILEISTTDPGVQGIGGVVVEKVTRPLIEIVERARPSGSVTVNIFHNFPLRGTTILVNGMPLTTVLTGVPVSPNITRFNIAASNLPAGPARISVTAIERQMPGTGVTCVTGRSEVQY